MSLYEAVVKPIAFRQDPETIHETAMGLIRRAPFLVQKPVIRKRESHHLGAVFPNPIGLAAGFDKNCIGADRWHAFGFGFAEIGTVTYHPQPGNEKPRLFRLPKDSALINRMGFNNAGAQAVATRLERLIPKIPIGINLGKSKLTPVDKAAEDYQNSFKLLHQYGDYFVINVSSPNTPGLRSLQEKGPLLEIIQAMKEVDSTRPILVKVAPDLEWEAISDVIDVVDQTQLAGLITTNTTISREGLTEDPGQAGGLSGLPLQKRSDEVLAFVAKNAPKNLVIMGVGGIMVADDVKRKMDLGAHLVQLYTGWIYKGPGMVPQMLREL